MWYRKSSDLLLLLSNCTIVTVFFSMKQKRFYILIFHIYLNDLKSKKLHILKMISINYVNQSTQVVWDCLGLLLTIIIRTKQKLLHPGLVGPGSFWCSKKLYFRLPNQMNSLTFWYRSISYYQHSYLLALLLFRTIEISRPRVPFICLFLGFPYKKETQLESSLVPDRCWEWY